MTKTLRVNSIKQNVSVSKLTQTVLLGLFIAHIQGKCFLIVYNINHIMIDFVLSFSLFY